MPSSFARFRSTRRTATVTTSAPDASIARIMSEFDAYLPVPTISRERNSRPPILSSETSSDVSRAIPISAPADEVHDLDDVSVVQRERRICIPVTENGPVMLDYD